jgi:uncharacterized membrane protein YphA (DoxX/SURF4 family)
MSISTTLDSIHAKARSYRLLHYFAGFNRIVLAAAFIPSGMTKLLGNRFTLLPLESPVGFFFEAFYRTGGWYRFVGFCQVLAAILLLIPRTATLGAAIFFPIVLNIMIITIAVGFTGTWVITSLMFIANLYLICWDYDKFKAILPLKSESKPFVLRKAWPVMAFWILGSVAAFGFFAMIHQWFRGLGIGGAVVSIVVGCILGFLNSIHSPNASPEVT